MKTEIMRDNNELIGVKLIPQTNDEFVVLKRFWDENDSEINYTTDCVLELTLCNRDAGNSNKKEEFNNKDAEFPLKFPLVITLIVMIISLIIVLIVAGLYILTQLPNR